MIEERKKEFISFMIESDVLKFGEFTTKSGRKTPYFINTGNYRTGRQFNALGKFYAQMVKESGCEYTAIFGPAYKGIPLAACCSNALYSQYNLDKPFFFNRKEVKDHGEGGSLVGYAPKDGDKIVIVEDVITAGTAVREVIPILRSCGEISCKDMFISVDRREIGQNFNKTAVDEVRDEFGINIHSIVDVNDIRKYLDGKAEFENYLEKMDEYMKKYCLV